MHADARARLPWILALLALPMLTSACTPSSLGGSSDGTTTQTPRARALRPVDADRLREADPRSWLSHGRDQAEQRYSPLDQIDEQNVSQLGLAWSFDLGTERGVEATPLVADGVLYVSAPWSLLHALDAATGDLLWSYDPQVPRAYARHICCGVVNRGVALWGDRVFMGTLDGRLVAVDRSTVRTLEDAFQQTLAARGSGHVWGRRAFRFEPDEVRATYRGDRPALRAATESITSRPA